MHRWVLRRLLERATCVARIVLFGLSGCIVVSAAWAQASTPDTATPVTATPVTATPDTALRNTATRDTVIRDTAAEQAEQLEHRRIEAARAAAESRFAAEELECRRRFVVSSCVEDAKRTRRAALKPLRERQIEIDTARRKRASAERADSIAKKAIDDGAKPGVSISSRPARKAAAVPASAVSASASGPGASPEPTMENGARASAVNAETPAETSARTERKPLPGKPMKPFKPQSLEPRVADEASHRTAYARRRREAVQHRQEIEARNSEQLAKRKPSNPLPPLSGQSASQTASNPSPPASAPR